MFVVYILFSKKNDKFYIGQTDDISKRLDRHNNGLVKSTKNGLPWQVVLIEEYTTRSLAMNRERQIKSYKGGNAFKKLVNKI